MSSQKPKIGIQMPKQAEGIVRNVPPNMRQAIKQGGRSLEAFKDDLLKVLRGQQDKLNSLNLRVDRLKLDTRIKKQQITTLQSSLV